MPEGKVMLAQLGQQNISLKALQEVLPSLDVPTPRQALVSLATTDAVASAALNIPGSERRPSATRRFHQALVQSYLKKKLEIELRPETVPEHYVEVAYKRMRPYFDHYDAYYIMDFMLLCCRESVGYCDANAERFESCFQELKSKSERVYDIVREADPQNEQEFEGLFSTAQLAVGDGLKFQSYSMFYDKSRTWDEMSDMNRLTKPVTHQAIKMKVGEISKPVRDSYGWHVLYLKGFDPEEHRDLTDPSVRLEIGEKIISKVRESEYTQLIQKSGSNRKVQVHFERLNRIIAELQQEN